MARSIYGRFDLVVLGLWLASLLSPSVSPAQVIEIGDGGSVTTYDRPEVFTADGATPIDPVRQPARRALSLGASRYALASAARNAELSPALVEAVAWRESHFRAGVMSRAGAIGEMQLMPATARSLGVDPRDTAQNYSGGAIYLKVLMRRYDGDLTRALAAYNAGPAAVDHYGGVPPFKETQTYVAAIMDRLSRQVTDVGEGLKGR